MIVSDKFGVSTPDIMGMEIRLYCKKHGYKFAEFFREAARRMMNPIAVQSQPAQRTVRYWEVTETTEDTARRLPAIPGTPAWEAEQERKREIQYILDKKAVVNELKTVLDARRMRLG